MGMLFRMATRNLGVHKIRTSLLGTAIALVTALLALLSGLFTGMQTTMLRTATTLMTGHVNVAGFYKPTSGTVAPVVTKAAALRAFVEKKTPGVKLIVTRGRGWGKVVSDKSSQQAALVGIDIGAEVGFRDVVQVKTGSLEGLREPHSCVIFQSTAKRLEVKVGDTVTLSAPTFRGVNNTVDVKIVAIGGDLGMFSGFNVYVPEATIRELYQLDPLTVGAIQLYVNEPDRAEEIAATLRADIEKAGWRVLPPVSQPFWRKFDTVKREDWTGQKIDVTTWTDEMQFMKWTLATVGTLITIIVGVLLVIISVGMMNALSMAIRERTREIGTLRAIGMQRGGILGLFVLEAALLGLGATIVGVVLAIGTAALVNGIGVGVGEDFQMFVMRETLWLEMDGGTVALSVGVIAAATIVASLGPAWRASRLPPVVAMQSAK
ncbi:MAG: ABC transporter permease [Myxococcales bacterium]|nr:ABC transporter permease [Myxococcales bacterium]